MTKQAVINDTQGDKGIIKPSRFSVAPMLDWWYCLFVQASGGGKGIYREPATKKRP